LEFGREELEDKVSHWPPT